MPIDYSRRDELNSQYAAQQKRLSDAQKRFEESTKGYSSGIPGQGGSSQQLADTDYQRKKGAYDAEKHAADVEISNLKPQLDEEESRIKAVSPFAELQQKQEMRAKEFRQAFPSILDSKLGAARTESRRKIAEGVGNTRASYNQRGLLYSGLRSGAEADVSQDAENDLADTAVKETDALNTQANELDQDAVNTGLTMADVSRNLAGTNSEYRQSLIDSLLNQDKQRQAAIGGLLGTGAQLTGLGLGAAIK